MQGSDAIPTIRRVTQEDAEAYLDCVASVAAERKYLARVDGFSLDGTNAFIESIVRHGWPMMVAVLNSSIVGWCDIIPRASVGYTHVASLSMGVARNWRGRGVGRQLLKQCLAAAGAVSFEKIELIVYADNVPAIHLYKSVGFINEGRKKDARKLDETYQDELLMALWI
jgi:ribosomal protein S18 acetylase RimI-like enzyme